MQNVIDIKCQNSYTRNFQLHTYRLNTILNSVTYRDILTETVLPYAESNYLENLSDSLAVFQTFIELLCHL